ncbi:mitochondrial carrier protein Mtm1p [[Candida] jaroonii]|uniref:Mitochondrial carrier protein Mtm1p n=1 Tax=[Candida] jaroonii TaxID=467808 RepID=A0ACA9YCN0_9ASCO|nr:mitochondrial carrier protein Mtm1p [[Candida] jaroonii]
MSLKLMKEGISLPQSNKPDVPIETSLTVSQRMMSASAGSILTAFILTPFDVIRIRMQQQEILPDSYPCCVDKIKNNEINGSSNLTKVPASSFKHIKSPESDLFWLDKEYCKSSNNCSKIDSTFQGFKIIAKNEGIKTLWRGMPLTLIMAVPANVVYFTGYEYARDHSPIKASSINSLLCGSIARLVAATSIAPIELVKTRVQSIPSSLSSTSASSISRSVMSDLWSQTKTRGLHSLFTGLSITLWRDVPFSGIYWSLYETSKSHIGSLLAVDFNNTTTENNWKVFTTSFLSGSLSGSVAAIATHPFDVGKTRLQITQSESHSNVGKYLLNIWKNEGFSALFGGLGPRVLKVAPSCAIMISSYEISKQFFKMSALQTL